MLDGVTGVTFSFVSRVVPDAVLVQGVWDSFHPFSIDSRTVAPGDIFVALPGQKVDGHDFIRQALEHGAAGIIIQATYQESLASVYGRYPKCIVLVVSDTYECIIQLATQWRAQLRVPVIAITGTVGKTSTKQLLAHMLHEAGATYLVSAGNQNTLVSIALLLLRVTSAHAGVVCEVGISKRGEMARIVAMLRPTIGLITCVGHGHLAGMGTLLDVASEKRDLFSSFGADSVGFINGDQPLLTNIAYPHLIVRFGTKLTNQVQARKIRIIDDCITFVLSLYKRKYQVSVSGTHRGFVYNILAAVSVAQYLGVSDAVILHALSTVPVVPGRFEKKQIVGTQMIVIHDCYNANPESMKAALEAFEKLETVDCKVAVIGDMLELGVDELFWHRQIGRFLKKTPSVRRFILVGSRVPALVATMPSDCRVDVVSTWQEAVPLIQPLLATPSVVLFKGSNGVGLYHIIDRLLDAHG